MHSYACDQTECNDFHLVLGEETFFFCHIEYACLYTSLMYMYIACMNYEIHHINMDYSISITLIEVTTNYKYSRLV